MVLRRHTWPTVFVAPSTSLVVSVCVHPTSPHSSSRPRAGQRSATVPFQWPHQGPGTVCLRPRDHISDALRQLHWLPVDRRIKIKLCVLMHSAHTSRCPKYLTNVLKPAVKYYRRPGLHSSSTNNYILPRLQSRLDERAFSYAGPLSWNSLPAELTFRTYLTPQLSRNV